MGKVESASHLWMAIGFVDQDERWMKSEAAYHRRRWRNQESGNL